MKVMIPINKTEKGQDCVASGFHNARFVHIYDMKSKTSEAMTTSMISVNSGDLIAQIKELGVEAVISTYLPPMTLQIFTRGGLQTFRARGTGVKENIGFLKQQQLESFTTEEARQMWGCNSGCGSCNSKSCA